MTPQWKRSRVVLFEPSSGATAIRTMQRHLPFGREFAGTVRPSEQNVTFLVVPLETDEGVTRQESTIKSELAPACAAHRQSGSNVDRHRAPALHDKGDRPDPWSEGGVVHSCGRS
jgi:hypothetical protein